MQNHEIQFLLYNTPDDNGSVQMVVKDETLWCTQKAMAQLFGVGVLAVSKHLKNIFEEGELEKNVVVSKMEITTQHGAIPDKSQTHDVDYYHLDAIIAVGYRVNSAKATKFRQWATKILSEYIKKGFAIDDERLKQGNAVFGKDYFRELLERVRSIRASERCIWQQFRFPFNESVCEKFVEIVKAMFDKQLQNVEEIENLTAQRDTLLPLLMNGQATVGEEA